MFHQVFTNQAPPQAPNSMTVELQNNLIVFEISNNWEFVQKLFFQMINGEISKVDTLETNWISYINSNSLDIRNYKDSDEFLDKHLRVLVTEQIKE